MKSTLNTRPVVESVTLTLSVYEAEALRYLAEDVKGHEDFQWRSVVARNLVNDLLGLRVAEYADAKVTPGVAEAMAEGKRIVAIKAYRSEHNVGLRQAKEAIDLAYPLR